MHAALFSGFQSIYTAVGTGTWIAGLMCGFSQLSLQQLSLQTPIELIGVPAVAGKKWLAQDIISLFEQIHKESDKQRLCESKSIDWKLNWSYPKKGFGPVDPLMLEILAGIFPFPLDPVYLPRVLYVLILEYLKGKREKSMVIHSGGLRPSMMLNKVLSMANYNLLR